MRAMLPTALLATLDPFLDSVLISWRVLGGTTPPAPAVEMAVRQRIWADLVCSSQYDGLNAAASGPATRARLLAVKTGV